MMVDMVIPVCVTILISTVGVVGARVSLSRFSFLALWEVTDGGR